MKPTDNEVREREKKEVTQTEPCWLPCTGEWGSSRWGRSPRSLQFASTPHSRTKAFIVQFVTGGSRSSSYVALHIADAHEATVSGPSSSPRAVQGTCMRSSYYVGSHTRHELLRRRTCNHVIIKIQVYDAKENSIQESRAGGGAGADGRTIRSPSEGVTGRLAGKTGLLLLEGRARTHRRAGGGDI